MNHKNGNQRHGKQNEKGTLHATLILESKPNLIYRPGCKSYRDIRYGPRGNFQTNTPTHEK
jgi:hypothetical protein